MTLPKPSKPFTGEMHQVHLVEKNSYNMLISFNSGISKIFIVIDILESVFFLASTIWIDLVHLDGHWSAKWLSGATEWNLS
jgi:hypothetical protein